MLHFLRAAALSATLLLVPAASMSSSPSQAVLQQAVVRAGAAPVAPQKPAPAPFSEFGLDAEHEHASGLAPGQTDEDFEVWAGRSPTNIRQLAAFRDYLAAQGLQFVRDDVIPSVGEVETLSAYRNGDLNACSNGAPKSAHREFFALDLTPVNKALDRTAMISSVCKAHAHDGQAYSVGLGFYSGRRFHVDSSGFRRWGANGKGATSPCINYA